MTALHLLHRAQTAAQNKDSQTRTSTTGNQGSSSLGAGSASGSKGSKLSLIERSSGSSSGSGSKGSKVSAAAAAAIAADDCAVGNPHVHEHTEYWGDVVAPGSQPSGRGRGLETDSAEGCCRSCKSTKGCNIWVWCQDPQICGRQCWLKRVGGAREVVSHGQGPAVPWTSGHLEKDYMRDPATLPPPDPTIDTLVLVTMYGRVRIKLRPDWHGPSVDFARRLAQLPELCTNKCEFYRAEPGFLLQGSLHAFIPPNSKTQEGPGFMQKGDIGWAGGGPGPDFFIYLGEQPAAHFGRSHTVWGQIADEDSMKLVQKMVMLPATAPKPGDMHMLDKNIEIRTDR
eukprot:CAMPEP_0202874538 /NCGR_PEP_ID=MMETSP1391-20130828/25593_1 /ASSEMBLY_ACC=CAM_ASM_000867 /TAXON_ID=1034604 /ORGANISM="Chlamydomonas leiostraca, Strain SAG 11-49" /LENGTH=340 /DNA_ID=CAMNT_0049555991 /DNA_START=48 /DNA_END=1070 /DNA_ORIENTATION=-